MGENQIKLVDTKIMYEDDFGFKFESFYIEPEGTSIRVIAEGIKDGEKKRVNGLFCARAMEAKFLVKYINNK